MHYDTQFDVASGQYTLRVVFSSGGASFGKLEMPLTIDPYDSKKFGLSGIALSKDIHRVSDLEMGLDAALLENKTPLVSSGMELTPYGSNRFKKTEMAAMYVEIYDPLLTEKNAPQVGMALRIVDRKTGRQKLDTGFMNMQAHVRAGNAVVPVGLKLPLEKLDPGTYRAEVKAMDTAGNASAVRQRSSSVERMSVFDSSRRGFLRAGMAALTMGAAGLGQRRTPEEPQTTSPQETQAPKTARVTSSVMLWTLKGSIEEKLAKAAEAGIQSVELVSEYVSWSDTDVARYKALAQSYGLTMDALLSQTDWTHRPVTMVNPAHREAFLKDVQDATAWAKKLDVGQVIVLSGNEQPGMAREAQHASMVEGGKRAAEIAKDAGVKLILENLNSRVNHKGYFLTSAKEALEVVKEVDSPHFRFLFDLYHEYVQNGNVIPTINEAAPYVSVFHVADAPGRHDPGTGEMKWDEIYRAIGKSEYTGYIALEYEPKGDEVASLIATVTQMRKGLNAGAKPETADSAS